MKNIVRENAKAIAALVAPWLVSLALWAIEAVGVDIAVDKASWVTAVASAVGAVIVWATSNNTPPAE